MKKLLKGDYGGGLNEVLLDQIDFFLNVSLIVHTADSK